MHPLLLASRLFSLHRALASLLEGREFLPVFGGLLLMSLDGGALVEPTYQFSLQFGFPV